MKTIMLMRHSHASSDNPAFSDHDRPLTSSGRALASTTAQQLFEIQTPDRILCSSATRTKETADILAAQLTVNTQPESLDSLYLAPAREYSNACADYLTDSTDTVLIVGHNPGIASLIATWANDHLSVSPATVAVFRVDVDHWQSLTRGDRFHAELSGLITQGTRVR